MDPTAILRRTYISSPVTRIHQLSKENKMTSDNLAVVFAPTLMRSDYTDVAVVMDFGIQKKLVSCLIRNCNSLFCT